MNLRRIRIGLYGLVVVALGAVLWFQVVAPRGAETVADTLGRGDYMLEATDGSAFTQASLEGTPSAVFFGFTYCPDVCPTTLGDIANWQAELAAEDITINYWFVTVDPARDTPEILRDYVGWVPDTRGVTGSQAEIDKAIRAFRIYANKVPLEGEDYTMDHSSLMLLFDSDGRFVEPLRYQEPFESAVAKLRALAAR